MAKKFGGDGFSTDPLDGEEAARHRHMFQVVDDQWVSVGDAIALIRAFSIIASILKVGGPIAIAMYALGAFAKSQGWL
jgi:hypothetical protein